MIQENNFTLFNIIHQNMLLANMMSVTFSYLIFCLKSRSSYEFSLINLILFKIHF